MIELREFLFELTIDVRHRFRDVGASVGGHGSRTCLGCLESLQDPDLGEARPDLRLQHRRELVLLDEHLLPDADLAEVVKKPRVAELLHLSLGEIDRPRTGLRSGRSSAARRRRSTR